MPLSVHSLTVQFYPPDEKLFPCLALAKEAARKKGPYPSLLVGADEVAVDAFLRREISFTQISLVIEQVLSSYNDNAPQTLEESLIILERGRERARALIRSAGRCGKERKSYDR
jgi:1-deoxy-D-xylulose-5-phosphate reductoisomerase